MKAFAYQAPAARIVFGAGSLAQLPAEVDRLGAKRVLMLCTPRRARTVREMANDLPLAGIFDEAAMHTPLELAEKARRRAMELGADCCVAFGGGSTIGFGKAIALTSGLPVIAVPTTYSGSEMTTIWGVSEGGAKKTGRDPRVAPRTVIYDPQVTLGLPAATSAASGMNAMAHCVEALYAHDGNPVVSLIAEEGIRALASALPRVVSNGSDLDARTDALYGAWLGGMSIATTSVALHHKLCHVLGGLGLPHAETHSIVLPHAMHYNAQAAHEAMGRVARAIGAVDADAGLWDMQQALGIPMRLSELGAQAGLKEADLERVARAALESPYPNPRKLEYGPVLELLRNAWQGRRP